MKAIDPEGLLKELDRAVGASIRKAKEVAVAFSGGLDSSIVAVVARRHASIRCYICAVPGSHDASIAQGSYASLRVRPKSIILRPEEMREVASRAAELTGSFDPIRIAYTIPLMRVIEESSESLILTGSGADEIFGGYSRYLRSPRPEDDMKDDLAKAIVEFQNLGAYAKSKGKRLACPFLDSRFLEFSTRLELKQKIEGERRKLILREVAGLLGLNSRDAPKKAAQYSSGVMREMERQARNAHMSLEEWVANAVIATKGRN